MKRILHSYSLPQETVTVIRIQYSNEKRKVRSQDGGRDFFDIVAGVLQGDTLVPYLFIICLDYELRKSIDKIKENCFKLSKKRSRRYPPKAITENCFKLSKKRSKRYLAKAISDTDYADVIALLANALTKAGNLLLNQERATAEIGIHVNAHKTEYMCFNQTCDISTLNSSSLKVVDKFTTVEALTETDINTRLAKP